jgi:hypothetical protein
MAQAVSQRPLTAEAPVRSRVSPCGICGGQSGTGIGFSRVLRFSPTKKPISFITASHNKPQACGASVASAAVPFTTQKKKHDRAKNMLGRNTK